MSVIHGVEKKQRETKNPGSSLCFHKNGEEGVLGDRRGGDWGAKRRNHLKTYAAIIRRALSKGDGTMVLLVP